ncbi:MAG: inosine monophosphate cyclohydrolase [Firmicutes bacterium]|nr:inosine monophosphate cyclohydrolase [Bacillota bacterium]
MRKLAANPYPGRGIILGLSPDGRTLIQVYWLMGRSENSRNRILVEENGFVKTQAFDEQKVTDPSLIIYYPMKHFGGCHLVTNGDQTETLYELLPQNQTFESALKTRTYEPDPPNYTPRISGLINLEDQDYAYQFSLIKAAYNNPDYPVYSFFYYKRGIPGFGHCLHTYAGDGNPLPPFSGEPYLVRLFNDGAENADYYWRLLNEENKVALLVKAISLEDGEAEIRIVNKHQTR